MINENETIAIIDFVDKLIPSVIKTLSDNLDNDVLTNIEISTDSADEVTNVKSYSNSCAFFKTDFYKGLITGSFGLLIPEDLLSIITDVMMGGNGEDEFSGELTELQANSSLRILQMIIKELEPSFHNCYSDDFSFKSNEQFYIKENSEFDDELINSDFDVLVTHTLTLNNSKSFTVSSLFNVETIKKILVDLKLLSVDGQKLSLGLNSVKLENLSNIKININAELGRASIPIKYALELKKDSMVELDTVNGEDIRVFSNKIEIAKAQIVVVDGNFGLRITKIIPKEERMKYV